MVQEIFEKKNDYEIEDNCSKGDNYYTWSWLFLVILKASCQSYNSHHCNMQIALFLRSFLLMIEKLSLNSLILSPHSYSGWLDWKCAQTKCSKSTQLFWSYKCKQKEDEISPKSHIIWFIIWSHVINQIVKKMGIYL